MTFPGRLRSSGNMPVVLLRFWAALCVLSLLSVAYTLVMTYVAKRHYPYGMPFIRTDVTTWDFRVFAERFAFFRTSHFWDPFQYPFTYPAPLGLVFGGLYRLPQPLGTYLSIIVGAVGAGAWWFVSQLMHRGIAGPLAVCFVLTLCITSWPLLVLLQRANIEGLVVILLALGVFSVFRGHGWTGATLIGIAASMKIFPIILAGLLLSRRQYKELAWCAIVIAGCTVGSLALLGPTIPSAQRHIDTGLTFFEQTFACNPQLEDLGEEHSLFTLVKLPVILLGDHSYEHSMSRVAIAAKEQMRHRLGSALTIYSMLVALGGIAMYFLRIRKLPLLNQVCILSICAVLLPPVSWDYTLPHLFLPFGLLCLYAVDTREGKDLPGLALCFACFAVLFTYGGFFVYKVKLSGQVRAVALCLLLVPLLRFPYFWKDQIQERHPMF